MSEDQYDRRKTRVGICPHCGKSVRFGKPKGGDGSIDVWFRHEIAYGIWCPMSREVVEVLR